MNNILKNIYHNKKVLVTGHTGFKGSWISLWLTELGAKVVGYSLEPPTNPNLFQSLRLDEKIKHYIGDIRDETNLKSVFQHEKPDIVFHLAAQPIVRLSYKEPKLTYETNIIGTINVLEAIKVVNTTRVAINITSDKCYENHEWVYGYRENDPMGGFDPYSSSKGCSELVTAAYRKSFFNPDQYNKTHCVSLATVRAGNVIGGGDWAVDRLIPDCIRSLINNETIIIRNPNATRPWQHVLEPLSGYLWLGALMWENPVAYSEGWNFGPDNEDVVSVEDIVKHLLQIWSDGSYQVNLETSLYEAKLLKLDISKARFNLKWKPVYTAYRALEETINWYKNYYARNKNEIYRYTINQIQEYIHSAQKLNIEWSLEK
jgi:CDP-glucose 4,6-dehydratase